MATPATIIDNNLPTVALVGRVNVGKSSLFNKIIEQNLALVSDIPGTTRTRNVAIATWRGKQFRMIDTGGLTFSEEVPLEDDIIKQTEIALKEADVIVFVIDITSGILPQERELARRLKKNVDKKPVILVANKADTIALHTEVYNSEWMKLGFGAPVPASAANGSNIGDVLDLVFKQLNNRKRREISHLEEEGKLKIQVLGAESLFPEHFEMECRDGDGREIPLQE
jgi:GTP-binding protein